MPRTTKKAKKRAPEYDHTGLIRDADALAGPVAALPRLAARMAARCDHSVSVHTVACGVAGRALGTDLLSACGLRGLVGEGVKALEGAAECERVCGDQLMMWSCVIEAGVRSGDAGAVDTATIDRLLLCVTVGGGCGDVCSYIGIGGSVRDDVSDVVLSGRVRGGVGVSGSVASGPLLLGYACGDSDEALRQNRLDVSVPDDCGECIEGLNAEDIEVSCLGVRGEPEGGVRVESGVCVDGGMTVQLCVEGGIREELVLRVYAFGMELGCSPLRLQVSHCVCVCVCAVCAGLVEHSCVCCPSCALAGGHHDGQYGVECGGA